MSKGTIIDHLFNGKLNAPVVTIKAKKSVIKLASGRLFIGRTPGRFIEVKGQRGGDELSIKEALDALGANKAAVKIFPLAATPGSHWIYFALFSTCKQTPGIKPLKQYIKVLKDKLNRKNAGVANRVLYPIQKKKVKERAKAARSVHDIRLRIPYEKERKQVIAEGDLLRLDKLVRGKRWCEANYKKLARTFLKAWCWQSPILRRNNHGNLVKNHAPKKLKDIGLIRVYAGYWLIRSLYGIEVRTEEIDNENGYPKVDKINNAKLIRKSAETALYYFALLKKSTQENHDDMVDLLKDAKRTGEPPLIHEYYRRKADGRKVLSGFRLTRFWQILNQLKSAAEGHG